ncbi:MAG: sugar-binding protein [Victivallaceae bacterium]|nr:sugar-binding protein [Victivallaceae bacterium]
MKKLFTGALLLLTVVCALFADTASVFSFEEWKWDYPSGVGFWADKDSKKPRYTRADDAVEGKSALQVELFGCKKFQGINMGPLHLPKGTKFLTFKVKMISGKLPTMIHLEEKAPGAEKPEFFQYHFPAPPLNRWHRVVLPLEKFTFAWGKGDKKLDIAHPLCMLLTGYTSDPAVFLIDDLRAETELSAEEEDSNRTGALPNASGVNLLPGDCSFESGPGSWVFWESKAAPRTVDTDAAQGRSSLQIPAGHRAMTPVLFEIRDPKCDYVLSFYAKSPAMAKTVISLHVWGNNWQYLRGSQVTVTQKWERYTLRIPADSGKITDFWLQFDVGDGEILLDAVQLEKGTHATAYTPSQPISARFTTGHDGEILYDTQLPVVFHGRIFNAGKVARTLSVSAKYQGKVFYSKAFAVAPGEVQSLAIDASFAKSTGYYPAQIIVADDKGAVIGEHSASFAVIPPYRGGDGFFGIQTSKLPADVMKKVGISVLRRHCQFWQYQEKDGPTKMPEKEYIDPYLANGIDWFCALGGLDVAPVWARSADSRMAREGTMNNYVKWAVAQAGKYARYFDLQNEPDLTLMHIPGINREKAVDYYCRMLRSVAPVVRAAGKKLAINTAGGGIGFGEQIFAKAGDSFDLYAVHPYTFPRIIAMDDRTVANPENGGFLSQMHAVRKLIARHDNKHELAIGELGWSLEMAASPDSPAAMRHAAYVSRTAMLARSFPECRFLIWYSGVDAPESGKYAYGIWRNDNGIRPLPAAGAYCWAIATMDRGRDFKMLLNQKIMLLRWRTPEQEYAAIWSPEGSDREIRIHLPEAECFDLFGTPLADHRFKIGETPCFLRAASLDRAVASLMKQIADAAPLNLQSSFCSRNTLTVTVNNPLPLPWKGTISFGKVSRPLSLAPGQAKTLELISDQIRPGTAGNLVAEDAKGKKFEYPVRLPKVVVVPKVKIANWRTFDFVNAGAQIQLQTRHDVDPPDPFIRWDGAKDLSVKGFLGYDKNYFYWMAEVTDDKHEVPFDKGLIWQNDAIQFAFDTLNNAVAGRQGYAEDDYEFGTSEGHVPWCWASPKGRRGPAEGVLSEIVRTGDKTVYRVAIPWKEIAPLAPQSGRIFGFCMTIHDRDDNVNNYRMAFGRGIAEGKTPAMFRKLMFE